MFRPLFIGGCLPPRYPPPLDTFVDPLAQNLGGQPQNHEAQPPSRPSLAKTSHPKGGVSPEGHFGTHLGNLCLGFGLGGLGFEVWGLAFSVLELGFGVGGLGFGNFSPRRACASKDPAPCGPAWTAAANHCWSACDNSWGWCGYGNGACKCIAMA